MRLATVAQIGSSLVTLHSNHFVPKHNPVRRNDVKVLEDFLSTRPNMLVLTGAGISTESGIPDYRSEGVGLYARTNHRPVQHMDFVKYDSVRRRYWARNFVGWPKFSQTQPNAIHRAVARFEREGRISGVITQNVDRLHTKAGSQNVVEIHGSGYTVGCMSCKFTIDRHKFQSILNTMNPEFKDAPSMIRPDGDVDIPQDYIDNFQIPSCPKCDGNLKPQIVFFGDNVPKDRVIATSKMVLDSDGLLVLGSSLLVFSGYRLVLQTKELNLPVAIVNIGETRGDHLADIKLNAKCGDVVPKLFWSSRGSTL